ncbi:MAG: nucleotide exchange factor GrpE [Candidatus Nanopelagicales bacterium]
MSERPANDGEEVRVTDRRRIDPETGAVRSPGGEQPAAPSAAGPGTSGSAAPGATGADAEAQPDVIEAEIVEDGSAASAAEVAELTNTLQRLAAEYKNYRDRTARDLAEARAAGRADVVRELLGTLDALVRADSHGELTGPAKALADNLSAALAKVGLESVGAEGDPFDPLVHEAMTHAAGEGFDGPTVTAVYEPGYKLGERIIRPARVAVTE